MDENFLLYTVSGECTRRMNHFPTNIVCYKCLYDANSRTAIYFIRFVFHDSCKHIKILQRLLYFVLRLFLVFIISVWFFVWLRLHRCSFWTYSLATSNVEYPHILFVWYTVSWIQNYAIFTVALLWHSTGISLTIHSIIICKERNKQTILCWTWIIQSKWNRFERNKKSQKKYWKMCGKISHL